ncbi:MAG TPA: hypothetical protein VJ187_00140 [Nitrospirota bacterium]|nr:hypothetical protein [Nitrospirota bacterium]
MSTPLSGNLTTPYTPPFKVVRQYFIVATIVFILLNGLMLFSYQYIQGYHFQPRLLAFVHIGVLGWATLIIMGAMTQLVPVILETSLCSVRLSQWGLWLYLAGVAGITAHFWLLAGGAGGMASVAIIAFLAIILFAANIGLTLRKVKAINITVVHIIAAILYLASVATLGLLLGLNLTFPFLRGNHLDYLALHAAIGFGGWFSMVIMGVSYKLLPMFSLSYTYRTWPGWTAFGLVNVGILGIVIEFILGNPFYSAVLIAAGLFMFSYQVWLIMAARMRKTLDLGLRHTMLAYGYIPITALLGLYIALSHGIPVIRQRVVLIFGFAVIFGCITFLVIGMMYKIVPFLVWFHKYSDQIGKEKVPLLKDMFSERIGNVQFWLSNIGVPGVMAGLFIENQMIVAIGLTITFISSLLFGYNMFTIFTKRPG